MVLTINTLEIDMITTVKSKYKQGKVLLDDSLDIPENCVIYVSYLSNSKDSFYLKASEQALSNIWDNSEDDIYEQLLQK